MLYGGQGLLANHRQERGAAVQKDMYQLVGTNCKGAMTDLVISVNELFISQLCS